MTDMGIRFISILLLTISLSFLTGKLAGKRTMQSIDASMSGLLSNIEMVEQIHKMNNKTSPKTMGPKKLVSDDPQL